MPYAICNEVYQGWDLADAAAHAARTGYDALEIAPFTVSRSVTDVSAAERGRLRDLVSRHGLTICGIHWVLAKTDGLHLTHPDATVRDRTARYLVELVDFCADLGGRVLVFGSPKQRSLQPGVDANGAWAWASAAFRDAVRRAEDRGIIICVEPLAPTETDFINTAEEARRFAAGFDSPAMQIILDVKAMCSEPTPIPQIIHASAGRFSHFHANDRNLKGPGFGEVDFRPIGAALRQVGYRGYISVEVFNFDEGPEVIASRSLAYLRETCGEAGL